MRRPVLTALLVTLLLGLSAQAVRASEQTFRLYSGITAYVLNPQGEDFDLGLDVRDLNLIANGPREVMYKVYDPDGNLVVREIIPDDGVASPNFPDRVGGWDHELQYYANIHAKGTHPTIRWSAWSDPARLATQVARTFENRIPGKRGIYRVVVVGEKDHYVTLRLSPDLKFAVGGHSTFMHGHGDLLSKRYIYVPKGTVGIHMAVAEPDEPRSRHFRLTGPDGKVLFDGMATGGYANPTEGPWQSASVKFPAGGYDGQLLTLEVSDGPNDYLIKVTLQRKEPYSDYVGMGALALYAPDEATANAIKGGTLEVGDQVFFHPFQVRFHQWLQQNPLNGNDQQKALRADLETIYRGFRMLETSDGRGSQSWTNWAYAMGYYGFKVFRPAWTIMSRNDVPSEVKDLIREGLIMAGDRLSFATQIEKVNGNAFAQINVALWYCHQATGDPIQKQRFETFWERWTTEGWGVGSGLSRSGDAQEHFSHDAHYGSYIMENWLGGTWVSPGIVDDAKNDPRFAKVMDRYFELYSYLYCREVDGRPVAANPWSTRTQQWAHDGEENWETRGGRKWKGDGGGDLTVSVNGGDEWFAARRPGYYMLTFHGRIAPEWMSRSFEGQLGFSGGTICQLTVPGKGPVLASVLNGPYGQGMDPSQWRNFHIHGVVGERWDGQPIVAAISEHHDAKLEGNTVTSSGEVRDAHVRSSRSYTYLPDAIECSVQLAQSDYARVLSIWAHERLWSEVRMAYEMIPFMGQTPDGKPTLVTALGANGQNLGELTDNAVEAQRVRIDRGGFGVEIQLEQPMRVMRGLNDTVMIELAHQNGKPVPAAQVALKYRLVPFR